MGWLVNGEAYRTGELRADNELFMDAVEKLQELDWKLCVLVNVLFVFVLPRHPLSPCKPDMAS